MNKALISFVCFFALACAGLSAQSFSWSWASTGGSINSDDCTGISVDAGNNIYVTGRFNNTAVFGATTLVTTGGFDVYVGKLDAGGTWQWVVKAGGTDSDYATDIETDANGYSYVTGYFQATATFGATVLTSAGGYEAYIAKLDPSGNWLWAVKGGGTQYDAGNGISIDGSGNCYATGYFAGTATFGATVLTSSGGDDVFVAKLDANGNWQWAVKGGWVNYESAYRITTDSAGTSYVTGYFSGVSYFGSNNVSAYNGADAYVAKIDSGGTWVWARRVAGGLYTDESMCAATDASGNIYVTGYFSGTAYFGSGTLTSVGYEDLFVVKYNPNGEWQWAKQAGSTGNDTHGQGIALNSGGEIFVTGYFRGTAVFGGVSLASSGNKDIFAAKMDASGNWVDAVKAGANYEDKGFAITVDNSGNILVAGFYTLLANFGSIALSAPGHGNEVFVARINGAVAGPKAPENLALTRSGTDMQLAWDPVTEDTANQPLLTDAYYIYVNTDGDPHGTFDYLDQTTGTGYSHSGAATTYPDCFYKVTAVKN